MRTVQIGISMLNSIDAQSITMMIAGVVNDNNSVNIYFYNRTKAVDTWNVLRSCKRLRSLHYIFTSQKRKEQRRKRRKRDEKEIGFCSTLLQRMTATLFAGCGSSAADPADTSKGDANASQATERSQRWMIPN